MTTVNLTFNTQINVCIFSVLNIALLKVYEIKYEYKLLTRIFR